VQAHVKLPARYNPHWVKVWFERHDTKYFYWLIPESGEKAVLGLIADKTEGARYLLDQFCTRHGFQVTDYQGALIPLHQPLRQLEWHQQGARVLLIGDAAAHVKITTVGGLVSGLWGAKAATQSLIQGTSYASNLGALNRELYLHDLIRWTLNRFSNEDYTQLLGGLNQTLRTLLAQRNRDSMAHAIGELAFSQPKLSALAIYRLLFPYRVPSVLPVLNPLAQLAQLEPE
jgi:flavin-dependent dehydrogenase